MDCPWSREVDLSAAVRDRGDRHWNAFHVHHTECAECHRELFPFSLGPAAPVGPEDAAPVGKAASDEDEADLHDEEHCGACHDGTRSFEVSDSCERCHAEEEE